MNKQLVAAWSQISRGVVKKLSRPGQNLSPRIGKNCLSLVKKIRCRVKKMVAAWLKNESRPSLEISHSMFEIIVAALLKISRGKPKKQSLHSRKISPSVVKK